MIIPATDYGVDVKKVRERIFEYFSARAEQSQWHPMSLLGWISKVVEVQKEVSDLEPRLYLLSAVDVTQREMIETFMGGLKARVSKEYTKNNADLAQDFESVIAKIPDDIKLNKHGLIATIQSDIHTSVDQVINEQSESLQNWFTLHCLLSLRDKYTEAWQQFLAKQRKSSDECVEELIMARVFIGDEVDKAKTKITKDVIALYEKYNFAQRQEWTEEQKEKMFKDIYDKVYDEVIAKHPFESSKVAKNVTDIYVQRRLLPKVIEISSRPTQLDTEGWFKWLSNRLSNLLGNDKRGKKDAENASTLLQKQLDALDLMLEPVTKYAPEVVLTAIKDATAALDGKTFFKIEDEFHGHIMRRLIEVLVKKQENWENNNSVPKKLEQARPELWLFFNGLVSGMDALDLLVSTVMQTVKKKLKEAFTVEVIDSTKRKLWDTGVILSSAIFQAEADLDLLNSMDDDKVLEGKLSKAKEHYEDIITTKIKEQLKEVLKDASLWTTIRGRIRAALEDAVEAASLSQDSLAGHRAKKFFQVLRAQLKLPAIITALPSIDDASVRYKGLDNQNRASLSGIVGKIMGGLPADNNIGMPIPPIPDRREEASTVHPQLAKDILASLRKDSNPSFNPRCRECCPICEIQCWHPDGQGHTGDHRSSHQPQGIVGNRAEDSKILCQESCISSAKKDQVFRFNDGIIVKYRNLKERFPTWENPPHEGLTPQPLKVREHIFQQKQDLLLKMHSNTVKNTNIDPSYTHDRETLRQELLKTCERSI